RGRAGEGQMRRIDDSAGGRSQLTGKITLALESPVVPATLRQTRQNRHSLPDHPGQSERQRDHRTIASTPPITPRNNTTYSHGFGPPAWRTRAIGRVRRIPVVMTLSVSASAGRKWRAGHGRGPPGHGRGFSGPTPSIRCIRDWTCCFPGEPTVPSAGTPTTAIRARLIAHSPPPGPPSLARWPARPFPS